MSLPRKPLVILLLLSYVIAGRAFAQRTPDQIQQLVNTRGISGEVAKQLIDRFSPVLICDQGEGEAFRDPWDFVQDNTGRDDGCRIKDTESGEWLEGGRRYSAQELVKLSQRTNTSDLAIEPRDSRKGIGHARTHTIPGGKAVFGDTRHLYDDLYSVKYFFFFDWNETAYSGGHGNHQGDWMCVDFQVRAPNGPNGVPSVDNARIEYALMHNHGRVLLVPRVNYYPVRGQGRGPLVVLERGTHEPWPNSGDRGRAGWPRGVRATQTWDDGTGFKSEHKVVREHEVGDNSLKYPTHGSVVDLLTSDSRSAELVRSFAGKWGEHAEDAEFLGWKLYDATNPRGPIDNKDMWERRFAPSEHRDNPMAADIWIDLK